MIEEGSDVQTKFVVGGIAQTEEKEGFFDKLKSIKPIDKKFDEYVMRSIFVDKSWVFWPL